MKILVLNSNLDITNYYKKHAVDIEIVYSTLPGIFDLQLVASKPGNGGVMTDFYSPEVMGAVRAMIKPLEYHAVIFAFNPADYTPFQQQELASTGGYTYGEDIYLGTQLATVRLDGNETLYATHELMHCICHKLERLNIPVLDEMDSTLVNGVYIPYYENNNPDAPDGNFAVTWANINKVTPHFDDFPPLIKQSPVYNPWAYDLQLQLLGLGYKLGLADGYFGPKTLAVIRNIQVNAGLAVDGIGGPLTLSCLK